MDFNMTALLAMLSGMLMSGAGKAFRVIGDIVWFMFARKYSIDGASELADALRLTSTLAIHTGKTNIWVFKAAAKILNSDQGFYIGRYGIFYVKEEIVQRVKDEPEGKIPYLYAFRGLSNLGKLIEDQVNGHCESTPNTNLLIMHFGDNGEHPSKSQGNPFFLTAKDEVIGKLHKTKLGNLCCIGSEFESRAVAKVKMYWHNPVFDGIEVIAKDFICQKNGPSRLGILIYGPGSSGKSDGIKWIAAKLDLDILNVSLDLFDPKGFGKFIDRHLFGNDSPVIVLLEDFGHLYNGAEPKNTDQTKRAVSMSQLLSAIDGSMTDRKIIWIITTNEPDTIYENLGRPLRSYEPKNYAYHDSPESNGVYGNSTRPGRMDICLHVGGLNSQQVDEVLEMYYPECPSEGRKEIHGKLMNMHDKTSATRPTIAKVIAEINNRKNKDLVAAALLESPAKE